MTGLPTDRTHPLDPPAALRTPAPISRLSYPDGHVGWLVTGHAAARAVLADSRFSARAELQHSPINAAGPAEPAPPGVFITMDPPDHTRYRRLLTGQFTVRRMRLLEPLIERYATEHLDAMEHHGHPSTWSRRSCCRSRRWLSASFSACPTPTAPGSSRTRR